MRNRNITLTVRHRKHGARTLVLRTLIIVALFTAIILVSIALASCARPAPIPMPPAPRVIFDQPLVNGALNTLVARDDYTGAGYTVPDVSLAAHVTLLWRDLNPANGVYNWTPLDNYLDAVEGQVTITASGDSVPRPVWVTIPSFWQQGADGDCANYVPAWLKTYAPDHVVIPYTPTPAATANPQNVPALDDPDFQAAYVTLIARLSEHVAALSETRAKHLAGFFIAGGYDTENQIEANYCRVTFDQSNIGNVFTPANYWQFLAAAVQAFHTYLPQYPIFTLAASQSWPSQRCDLETQLLSYPSRHIGWGFNGMAADVPAFYTDLLPPINSSAGCGPFDVLRRDLGILPSKFEPAAAYQSDYQRMYWAWLLALTFQTDMVDTQDEWFSDENGESNFEPINNTYGFPTSWYEFVTRQLGNTMDSTQDAWLAFHTTEYPAQGAGLNGFLCGNGSNSFCHGFEGDLTHGLAVIAGTVTPRCSVYGMPTCQDAGLPTHTGTPPEGASTNPYSRHAGQLTSETITLAISPTNPYAGQNLNHTYLRIAYLGDSSKPLTIVWPIRRNGDSASASFDLTNDGQWHWAEIHLDGILIGNMLASRGQFDIIRYPSANPTLHMVWLDMSAESSIITFPTPTPTATPTPAATPTATPTPGPFSAHWTEYSPHTAWDWFPDGKTNASDGFVEFFNENSADFNFSGWTLELIDANTGTIQTFPLTMQVSGLRHYAIFGADLPGVTWPTAATANLRDDVGTLIISGTWGLAPGALTSWQWCANTWAADLPTPGEDCQYWQSNPTPTSIP